MYTYPDVVGLCDPPQFEDAHGDTLLNPAVIFEVLSPSTEAYDRGTKFSHYRKIASLREYILVTQNEMRLEQYIRHGEHWMLAEITGSDAVLRVETLGCELPLGEIYRRVDFPPAGPVRTTE
jgi:Uma2 family endonuclease